MLKDITLGQYFPGDSIMHRTDPRVKIVLTTVFMILIFIVNTIPGFIISALFTLLTVMVSGIPLSYTLKGLKPLLFIVLFTAVINIFTAGGTPVFDYGFLRYITWEGIEMAVMMSLRLSLLVVGASVLTLTTTPIALTDGIEKLMAPLKAVNVPVHEIAMMMTIALRFIPTLLEETDKIMKAQAARGADFDTGSLLQRAKSFIPVLVPLFISAFRRADELATAMESRCYRGSEGRTRMKQLKLTVVDVQVSVIMAVFIAGVLILQYM